MGAALLLLAVVVRLWVLSGPQPGPIESGEAANREAILVDEPAPGPEEVTPPDFGGGAVEPKPPTGATQLDEKLFRILKQQHTQLPINKPKRVDVPIKAQVVGDLEKAAVQITSTLRKSDNINQLTDLVDDASVYPGSVLRARSLVDDGAAVPFSILPLGKMKVSLHGIRQAHGDAKDAVTNVLDNSVSAYGSWLAGVGGAAVCVPTTQLQYFACYSAEDFRFEMESSVQSPWANVEASFKRMEHREDVYLCVVYTEKHFRVAVDTPSPEKWFDSSLLTDALLVRAENELLVEEAQRHLRSDPLAYVSQVDYGRTFVWVSQACKVNELVNQGIDVESGKVNVSQSFFQSKELQVISGTLFQTGAVKSASATVSSVSEAGAKTLGQVLALAEQSRLTANDGIKLSDALSAPISAQVKYLFGNGLLQRRRFCVADLMNPRGPECRPLQILARVERAAIGWDGLSGFTEFWGGKSSWAISLTVRDKFAEATDLGVRLDETFSYRDDGHSDPGQICQHGWSLVAPVGASTAISVAFKAGEGTDSYPGAQGYMDFDVKDITVLPRGVEFPGLEGGRKREFEARQSYGGHRDNSWTISVEGRLNPLIVEQIRAAKRKVAEGERQVSDMSGETKK